MFIHIYIYLYIYTYIHTCLYIYIYTYLCQGSRGIDSVTSFEAQALRSRNTKTRAPLGLRRWSGVHGTRRHHIHRTHDWSYWTNDRMIVTFLEWHEHIYIYMYNIYIYIFTFEGPPIWNLLGVDRPDSAPRSCVTRRRNVRLRRWRRIWWMEVTRLEFLGASEMGECNLWRCDF